MQLRDASDSEAAQRYTVKRYRSEKSRNDDSWRRTSITLEPINSDFQSIMLAGANPGELQVIAELVDVLENES